MSLNLTPNIPQSITAAQSGVSLSFLKFHLINNFHLPKPVVDDCLESYFLLYNSPQYVRDSIINGQIWHDGNPYNIVYKNCGPTSIMSHAQVKLSYRKPKKEYNSVGNYVIIMKGCV